MAVALLLAAAALTAVDLSGLVDVVYNKSLPLERFAPTYVFEVDGCRVLVYVADPALKNSPLAVQMRDEVYYSHKMVLRSLTSAEVERLLDALFQVLGPSTEAWVAVWTKYSSWQDEWRYEILHVEAKDAAQLAEETRRAAGVDFYLGAADARETLSKKYEASKGAAVEVAYLHQVVWRHGDLIAVFLQSDLSARLEVWTANLSAAVEALRKAREAASGVWNSVKVELWHGPYLISDDEAEALRKAVWMLDEEHRGVWEFRDKEGRVRRVWGTVSLAVDGVGPPYVIFPRPSDVTPDETTAERLVRRFVELSGFCKSPLVVEFWPRPELEPPSMEQSPPLWLYIFVAGAAVAAVALFAARRRRS